MQIIHRLLCVKRVGGLVSLFLEIVLPFLRTHSHISTFEFISFVSTNFFNCNVAWAASNTIECEQKSHCFGMTKSIHWLGFYERHTFAGIILISAFFI